jgi:hypothetical protein
MFASPEFETSGLSYRKLERLVADLHHEQREIAQRLAAATQDVYLRRIDLLRRGKELPEPGPLQLLADWQAQRRREQVAADNRRADEALARDPRLRGSFVLPS